MVASKHGCDKVVELILFHPDVQVNKETWHNETTALIYACEHNHAAVVGLLLRCPETDVSHQNNNLKTAQEIALNSRNITKVFENHQIVISIKNKGHSCCSGQMKKSL